MGRAGTGRAGTGGGSGGGSGGRSPRSRASQTSRPCASRSFCSLRGPGDGRGAERGGCGQAAERIREIFETQTVPLIAAIAGKAGARERAALVVSQTLGMALCRHILKIPPLVNMPRKKLVEEMGKTLQRYMTE
jgi:hypothetical protein